MTYLHRARRAAVSLALLGTMVGCAESAAQIDDRESADTGVPVTVRSEDGGDAADAAQLDAGLPGSELARDAAADGRVASDADSAAPTTPTGPEVVPVPDAGGPLAPPAADAAVAPPAPPTVDAGAPVQASLCTLGSYSGPLSGQYMFGLNAPSVLSGTFSFRLALANDGASAVLLDVRLEATTDTGRKITGNALGAVDCSTGKLSNGLLAGSLSVVDGTPSVPLNGMLTGASVAGSGVFDGSFSMEGPGIVVSGGYQAALAAP